MYDVSIPRGNHCYPISHINKHMAPALFPVARLNIARRGVAGESIISKISPATKRRTTRKMEPVMVPIPTQAIMILGPVSRGFGISTISKNQICLSEGLGFLFLYLPSIIWATASKPVTPRPPCNSPSNQAIPSGQPVWLTKLRKTNLSELVSKTIRIMYR